MTSARVPPGLLSWQAWEALRGARRVLVSSPGHPQVPALAEAGVTTEAVGSPDASGLAPLLAEAASGGDVVWLAPAGTGADPGLLAALAPPGPGARVLHGSRDLPGAHLLDVVATMDTLRSACPWDREQTHASLAPYLLEEPYEALAALEDGDDAALREELGDVLFQVVFHARIAAERPAGDGGYTIDDLADTLVAKLVRRHPHVFAGAVVSSAADVNRNWEEIKKAERAARAADGPADPPSVLDGVALGQPALSLAAKVLRRAARAGVPGELLEQGDAPGEARPLGTELLRIVARAGETDADPELELRAAARAYASRVRDWERSRLARGLTRCVRYRRARLPRRGSLR